MAVEEPISGTHKASLLLAERLRMAVSRFVRRVRLQADTPTTAQSETLALLEKEGPLSVAELAGRRGVRHQSMRLVTAQLEAAGLIRRLVNPADRRSQLLVVTEAGAEELSRSRDARTSSIAGLIEARLNEDDRRTLEAAILVIERLC